MGEYGEEGDWTSDGVSVASRVRDTRLQTGTAEDVAGERPSELHEPSEDCRKMIEETHHRENWKRGE